MARLLFVTLALWAGCTAAATAGADAADRVYWANYGAVNSIGYANLDGSGAGGNLAGTGATGANASGLAIAMGQGRAYWSGDTAISYTDLDGQSGGDLSTGTAPIASPKGVAVDPAAGRIYWANSFPGGIAFANLDGSGGGGLATTGATVSTPIGVAIDPAAGRIYWGNVAGNTISYARLDGSGGGNLNTTGATVNNPQGLAIDPAAGRIYWANVYGNSISYARLDGSGGGNLNTTGATVANPAGIAIDAAAGRIYWGNVAGNTISYANLDGSGGGGDLSTTGATTSAPIDPVVVRTPVAIDAPGVTADDRTLSCSQGSWAADLVASFAYRSPASFAFAWSRDGVALPGTSGRTYLVPDSDSGEYRCAVTASNPAGASRQTSEPFRLAVHEPAEVGPLSPTPPPSPLPAPALGRLAIRPHAFLAAPRGSAQVKFTLSRAAAVRFTVKRRGVGGLVGLHPSFVRAGRAGPNHFRFGARLRGRSLAAGHYVLVAVPVGSTTAAARSAAFVILLGG